MLVNRTFILYSTILLGMCYWIAFVLGCRFSELLGMLLKGRAQRRVLSATVLISLVFPSISNNFYCIVRFNFLFLLGLSGFFRKTKQTTLWTWDQTCFLSNFQKFVFPYCGMRARWSSTLLSSYLNFMMLFLLPSLALLCSTAVLSWISESSSESMCPSWQASFLYLRWSSGFRDHGRPKSYMLSNGHTRLCSDGIGISKKCQRTKWPQERYPLSWHSRRRVTLIPVIDANIPLLWSPLPRGTPPMDGRRQRTKMGELENKEEKGEDTVDVM